VGGGRDILYLANSGEITAMFVLSYRVKPDIARQLERLADLDMRLAVHTTDPNITPDKVAEAYDYPAELIQLIPASLHGEYRALTGEHPRASARIICTGGSAQRLRATLAAMSVRGSVTMGTVIQLIGMVLGYVLVSYLSFMGNVAAMGFWQLIVYQLFWASAVITAPNLRRL
jgi:hypothetical protein